MTVVHKDWRQRDQPRFVIQCTAASARHGWYWIEGPFWTPTLERARVFDFVTDAQLVGIAEIPLTLQDWDVVPVEWPEAAE